MALTPFYDIKLNVHVYKDEDGNLHKFVGHELLENIPNGTAERSDAISFLSECVETLDGVDKIPSVKMDRR